MTPEERAANLIADLDSLARDHDHYEYGLPVFSDEAMAGMTKLVADAIREAVKEEREACAREADPKGIRHLLPASEMTRQRQALISAVQRGIATAIRARRTT